MMRIGIGTVQFGLPYGITNTAGQVSRIEARAILARARDVGVGVIDTAAAYGDSETVLGATLPADWDVQIVTKVPKAVDLGSGGDVVEGTFARSLCALRRQHVYGLIVHDADDLLGPRGQTVWSAMERLKVSGKVARIGASVYSGGQIDALLDLYPLDLVQLPFNAVDARLVEGGQLDRLAQEGVEVHARSVFLQGLLLQSPDTIPERFGPLAKAVAALQAMFAEVGLTPLEGMLAAAFKRSEIDCVILGVTSVEEFEALIAAAKRAEMFATSLPVDALTIRDERILSPNRWAELA